MASETDFNYVGKNESLSVQLKLPKPEYNFEEQTIDNGTKIFVCTASIRDISVQDSGASKKRAKNSAAKLMYEKLYNIKEQDVSTKQPMTKEKLLVEHVSIEKQQDEMPTGSEPIVESDNLTEGIRTQLKARLEENHFKHRTCKSSEKLLKQLCLLENNPALNKVWPNRRLHFLLDSSSLIELSKNEEVDEGIDIDQPLFYRVFLAIRDEKSGQTNHLFVGSGSSINEARQIASCRAVSYIACKLGIK